jgi:hypothetical protein
MIRLGLWWDGDDHQKRAILFGVKQARFHAGR